AGAIVTVCWPVIARYPELCAASGVVGDRAIVTGKPGSPEPDDAGDEHLGSVWTDADSAGDVAVSGLGIELPPQFTAAGRVVGDRPMVILALIRVKACGAGNEHPRAVPTGREPVRMCATALPIG